MNLQTQYIIPTTVLLQCVDDETMLFNSATGLFFSLNEVGAIMWEKMSESDVLQDVFDYMTELYEVNANVLTNDIIVFANSLAEQGLVNFETKE